MQSIASIIIKNFKLLLRSKTSALIVVLGPLLVIFLVGIAFDNMEKYTLNVGVYSSDYSDLTESMIIKLKENNFGVHKISSLDECIDRVKQESVHTCIEFPPGFKIEEGAANEITLHVDYSKLNLVFMILDTLSTSIEEKESEISEDLTGLLVDKLDSVKVNIYNLKPSIAELRSQNEQLISNLNKLKSDVLSVKVREFKDTSSAIKTNILSKVTSARNTITTTRSAVSNVLADGNVSLYVSNMTKTSIDDKLTLIDTYLYNIYSILEDPNELTESDWSKVMKLVDSIEKDFGSIQASLNQIVNTGSENTRRIDQLQSSLNSITSDIESLRITNATTIVSPISTNIKPVVSEKTYLTYLFPSLIILVIMFISILLSTTLVMMEKHSPAYFRTFLTPTNQLIFIVSTYLTNLMLVFVQVAIILGISSFFFKSQIEASLAPSLLILFVATSLFTFIGMAIGYIFKSEETATLAAISTGSILLFLSNVILPLESMPQYIAKIAEFNPFVIAESLLRKAMLFQIEISSVAKDFYLLIAYSVIVFALIWAFHTLSKKHLGSKFIPPEEKKPKKKKEK